MGMGVSLGINENVLELDSSDGYTTLQTTECILKKSEILQYANYISIKLVKIK